VGESGSGTTIMTGMAVVEAVKDLKQQMVSQGSRRPMRRLSWLAIEVRELVEVHHREALASGVSPFEV
jgi:hypothetical protein